MYTLFLIILFILGACLGSFLCCQARRLRFRSENQSPKTTSTKKTKGNYRLGSRSICLKCGHTLHWYDNIPLVSWFILRGRCRHCHQPIGWLELVSEFGLAFAFLIFGIGFSVAQGFAFDPSFTLTASFNSALIWGLFLLSLLLICFLGFLAIYDAAYGELPTLILILSIILAAAILLLKQLNPFLVHGFTPTLILEPLGAVALLGGLYLFLYLVSKGQWVGDGDWLLGLALGLALATPWLALVNLFLANLLACLVMIPILLHQRTVNTTKSVSATAQTSQNTKIKSRLVKRGNRGSHHLAATRVPLGPFLIIAFVIVYSFSDFFTILL